MTEKDAQSPKEVHAKLDAIVNAVSGFGGSNDPVTRSTFQSGAILTREELEIMYRFDWTTRRACDVIPEDATREGFTIQMDDDNLIAELLEDLKRLKVPQKIKKACKLANLHGGSVILLGALDGAGENTESPLNIDSISEVAFLTVFDRWQLHIAQKYDDPLQAKYGEPEIYEIKPISHDKSTLQNRKIHETRLLRFDGALLPDYVLELNQGWHDSIIIAIHDALKHFQISTQAGAVLFQDFVTKVLKMPSLATLMLNKEYDLIEKRIQLAVGKMSSVGIAVIGNDEEMDKFQTPITGLVELMDKYIEYVCAAIETPRARFFGQQLGVLAGATETTRQYYDRVGVYQEDKIRNPLEYLLTLLMAAKGKTPDKWSVKFNSLYKETEKEIAETRKAQADTDAIYIDRQVLSPEEVTASRFGSGEYSIETTINTNERREFNKEKKDVDIDHEHQFMYDDRPFYTNSTFDAADGHYHNGMLGGESFNTGSAIYDEDENDHYHEFVFENETRRTSGRL